MGRALDALSSSHRRKLEREAEMQKEVAERQRLINMMMATKYKQKPGDGRDRG